MAALRTLVTIVAVSLTFQALASVADDYAQLLRWEFSQPVPLPASGITFTRDTATWTLRTGTVRVMRPLSGGAVTGIVFEGTGHFRMTIPDRYELEQLQRFADKKLDAIDSNFTQLVLRTTDRALIELFPRGGEPYAMVPLAEKRHEIWLTKRFHDTDAVIVAALLNGGEKTTIDVNTAAFDWLTWDYDSTQHEEISLTRYHPKLPEVWINLDRAEDRRENGRPGERQSANAALRHIDVVADLTRRGDLGKVGRHGQRTIDGRYAVTSTFEALEGDLHALRLELWAMARELEAFGEDGTPLTVLRDHIGKRSGMLDNRLYDNDFVVVLPEPMQRGDTRRIRFEYEVETANFAPGNVWYPTVIDTFGQKHTARLELTVHKRNEVRAMGKLESKREGEKTETTVWTVERPAKMITFSTATRFEEVRLESKEVPPVIAFGPDFQFDNRDKMHNVAADVANSLAYFQRIFGDKVGVDEFYVTSIAARHGQAFEGFLHLGEFTFASERAGKSELFRAHEVAHMWFGHKIGFASYRDQWLSESLAEYCAMLFVRDTVKDGDEYFEEILAAYEGIVRGNLAGGFSRFNRPWLIERSGAERHRTGPIGHGWRANTGDVQTAYVVAAYHKGPLVLHMLHRLLGDPLFFSVLREFVREMKGKHASAEDLRRVIERNAPGDWNWFFDAWIYRGAIPVYTWRYDVTPAGNAFDVTIRLQRRDVGSGFKAMIPVKIDDAVFVIDNDRDEQSVTKRVASRPKSVIFAPEHSLLASVRRD
jgi:Peptidase family M1 domain